MSDNRNSGTRQVRQDGIGVTAGPTSPFATAGICPTQSGGVKTQPSRDVASAPKSENGSESTDGGAARTPEPPTDK